MIREYAYVTRIHTAPTEYLYYSTIIQEYAAWKLQKERKKTDNPREGWEDGTPPPHRDFKERGVVR